MADDPYTPPESPVAAASQRVRPLWRWLSAAAAIFILLWVYVSYEAARAVNAHYFHNYEPPTLSASEVGFSLFAVPLLWFAVIGRWRLFRRRAQPNGAA